MTLRGLKTWLRRRRRPGATAIASLALAAALVHADASMAAPCASGASPPKSEWCDYFVEYVPRGQRAVDPRINSRFGDAAPGDPDIRSFAFVISISKYDNLIDPKDRNLTGVRNDLPNIISFLKEQQFDEIIVLKDDQVTPETIRDVFDLYLIKQIRANQGRARFLFAYDGHGAPPPDPSLPGGLALSSIIGAQDSNPDHSFPLDELALKLKTIATFSLQSLALLGSCYSGGALFPYRSSNYDTTYSLRPGAHVVAAARKDELAISYPDGRATFFFDSIISAVRQSKQPEYTFSFDTTADTVVLNNAIVRLGDVVNAINDALEKLQGQPYPRLRIAEMAPNKNFEGAFFFLINQAPTIARVANQLDTAHGGFRSGYRGRANGNSAGGAFGKYLKSDLDPRSMAAIEKTRSELVRSAIVKPASIDGNTGSSIKGKPAIVIFNVPETYRIRGVDLSQDSGKVDFRKLRDNDIRFVYLHATQGAGLVDPAFRSYREQAAKAGLLTGAYHVFSFCQPVADQMANLKEVIPADPAALPVAIDVEWVGRPALKSEETCNAPGDIRARLHDLADEIQRYTGKLPIFYAAPQAIRGLFDASFDRYSLWIASYSADVANKAVPSRSSNPWTLWQFTDRAQFPGTKKPVDLNAFFGNEAQFEAFREGRSNAALAATRTRPRR